MFGIYKEGNSEFTMYICIEEMTELKDKGKEGTMFTRHRTDLIVPSPLFLSARHKPNRRLFVGEYLCADSILFTDTTFSIPPNSIVGYHLLVPNGLFDRLRRQEFITRRITRKDFRSNQKMQVHFRLVNSILDLCNIS